MTKQPGTAWEFALQKASDLGVTVYRRRKTTRFFGDYDLQKQHARVFASDDNEAACILFHELAHHIQGQMWSHYNDAVITLDLYKKDKSIKKPFVRGSLFTVVECEHEAELVGLHMLTIVAPHLRDFYIGSANAYLKMLLDDFIDTSDKDFLSIKKIISMKKLHRLIDEKYIY